MKENNMLIKVMDWLRFPLIVLVVYIHSNPECVISPWSYGMPFSFITMFTLTEVVIQKVIAAAAVPGFFFISGYLFFYKIDNYNLNTYRSKLSRRIWTLLIPYLLWNTLPVIYPLLLFLFRGQPLTFSFAEWLSSYWDTGGEYHFPANFPLWYVRDLMIACLITPVIWSLTKRRVLGGVFITMLTIAYVFKLWPSIVGHTNSVFFFYIGSFMSIIKADVLQLFHKVEKVNYAITFILCIMCVWFYVSCKENYYALMPLYTISSLVSIINVSSRLVSNTCNIWDYLKERVFFIYASHTLFFVSFVEVLLYSNLQHQPLLILFVIYLLMPFLKISICVIIYNFMAKYMPKSLAILNGRRGKRDT